MSAAEAPDPEDARYREVTTRFWVFALVTQVHDDGLYVRLTPLQQSFRRLPAADIDSVEATTYSVRSYRGWHWGLRRTLHGTTIYRLRGRGGVEVTHADGDRWFVGSRHPEALETALERVVDGE